MSSFLSGGGRGAYRLDLEVIKSQSSSWISNPSSHSSALSESSNPSSAIATRKPRMPRKRPNQTYNEAAAILSTAYPKIFSIKHLGKSGKFTRPQTTFPYEDQDLFLPFQLQEVSNSCFLLHPPVNDKQNNYREVVNLRERPCQSPGEINSKGDSLDICDEFHEDFDADSILSEGIQEGIDSIMVNLCVNNDSVEDSNAYLMANMNTCCGYGMKSNAFRNCNDQKDCWRFPPVKITDITPKFKKIVRNGGLISASITKIPSEKRKKKVRKLITSKKNTESAEKNYSFSNRANKHNPALKASKQEPLPKPNSGLLLKLNYEEVLNAWSARSSPLPDELLCFKASGDDIQSMQTRLAKIDLFPENLRVHVPGLLLKLNYEEVLNAWSTRYSPLSDELLCFKASGDDIQYADKALAKIDLFAESLGVQVPEAIFQKA